MSIRSVGQKTVDEKCGSEVLLIRVNQKCGSAAVLKLSIRSVNQKCESKAVAQKCRSEVLLRKVDQKKCGSEVLIMSLRSVDQKCCSEKSIRKSVAQKCCSEVSIRKSLDIPLRTYSLSFSKFRRSDGFLVVFWKIWASFRKSSRAMFLLPLAPVPASAFVLTPADARNLLNILINLQPTLNSGLAHAFVQFVENRLIYKKLIYIPQRRFLDLRAFAGFCGCCAGFAGVVRAKVGAAKCMDTGLKQL